MQQGLTLAPPTTQIAARAILFDLRNVSSNRAPAFDLAEVIHAASALIIPAKPLKPAAGIIVINPAFLFPNRERLRRIDTEVIQLRIVPLATKFCAREPAARKFSHAISHVFSAEDAELEHLLRRKLGPELRVKIAAGRFR